MLKRHNQLFLTALTVVDLALTGLAWLAVYYFRYEVPATRDWLVEAFGVLPVIPPFEEYRNALVVVLLVSAVCYRALGLYQPRREGLLMQEVVDVCKATGLSVVVLLALAVFYRDFEFSRSFVLCYLLVVSVFLVMSHVTLRVVLREMRLRGHNLRHVAVVGAGRLGQEVIDRLRNNPWMGLHPVGFVDDSPERRGALVRGLPVLGSLAELPGIIRRLRVDQVICALPHEEHLKLKDLLDALAQEVVDVRIVPDLFSFIALNPSVGDLDGLPIVSLREGPMHGWNQVLKRVTDVGFSILAIAVTAPVMAAITAAIRLTSPGPILFRQKRMSLDGKMFDILKFRTMGVDAERHTGPVWASEADPRRTRLGGFLRRTSLDELPQFFNVLKGDMSIVGPRPERPEFIDSFRTTIPRYMLRHKIKAGITGWAQVNGWRGNTSLEKRIQYDLYYIEHWSVWFDLRIMLLTVFRGLVHKNAY